MTAFLLIVYLWEADVPMRCYSCTSTETASQCETNPSTLPHSILDVCPREACTIVRVEEWPSRRVKSVIDVISTIISLSLTVLSFCRSFYRGCDGRTRVFERNNCQIEKDERTCFTACVGDLCNLGDGLVVDDIVNSASTGYEAVNRMTMIGTVLVTFFLGRGAWDGPRVIPRKSIDPFPPTRYHIYPIESLCGEIGDGIAFLGPNPRWNKSFVISTTLRAAAAATKIK